MVQETKARKKSCCKGYGGLSNLPMEQWLGMHQAGKDIYANNLLKWLNLIWKMVCDASNRKDVSFVNGANSHRQLVSQQLTAMPYLNGLQPPNLISRISHYSIKIAR